MQPQNQAFVSFIVDGLLCALPVALVRDVLRRQVVAPIALAPPAIAGNINLRGRIVTAIDIGRRLALRAARPPDPIALVAEADGELYALLVDQVCEVLSPEPAWFEPLPPTLPQSWTRFATGLVRLDNAIMLLLDLPRLLALGDMAA